MLILTTLFVITLTNGLEISESHQKIVQYPTSTKESYYYTTESEFIDGYSNRKDDLITKQFLQEYRSKNPVVILVDSVEKSYQDASNFLKNLYRISPRAPYINFMLMTFNRSGVSYVLETTQNNRERLEYLLEKSTLENQSYLGGRKDGNKTAAFFGILNAIHTLQSDSAVVLFIKRPIEDELLAQHALTEAAKKRVKIFVIWGGKPTFRREEALLKEVATHSGGLFMMKPISDLSDEYYMNFLENTPTSAALSTIISKKNLIGVNNVVFPIDSQVTGIHISISPNVTSGTLTNPKDQEIDVLNGGQIAAYATGSFLRRDPSNNLHEIHLNISKTGTPSVGLWRLRVSNARTYYNVAVFAYTKITTNALLISTNNFTGNLPSNSSGNVQKVMKLGLSGNIGLITNISFVTPNGQPIRENVRFSLGNNWDQHLTEDVENIETDERKEVNIVDVADIPKQPFYAVINGKDSHGNDFTRLSYVREYRQDDLCPLPPISVELGVGSELITQPNRQPQLFFEVTNNGHKAVLVRFYCKDERSILLSMSPWFQWIGPRETTIVRVTLTTRPGSYQDLITFSAVGADTAEKSVTVDVGLNNNQDDDRVPELNYAFTSDCLHVLWGSCEGGTWRVEARARDTGSGLLQLTSKPKGLSFCNNGFTTGTKEEVRGYFSESCCNPDLQLIAVDRRNNWRRVDINAYRNYLGPGAIAAIVLGVIILIVLLILLALCIRKCCKKPGPRETGSYDLPTYRGPATSSRRI